MIESLVDCTLEATILLASHDLGEIESFAIHVAYLNEGRLEFVEEMDSLNARFRNGRGREEVFRRFANSATSRLAR